MSKLRWDKARKPKATEPAFEKPKQKAKGGWTHIKRLPCRTLTRSEIEQWKRDRGME